jgi:hypothetical protein
MNQTDRFESQLNADQSTQFKAACPVTYVSLNTVELVLKHLAFVVVKFFLSLLEMTSGCVLVV